MKMNSKSPKKIEKVNAFARFSSIGIQMAVIILGFVLLGDYLDNYFETITPWLTIVFSLAGVFGGLYLVIKEVISLNKD